MDEKIIQPTHLLIDMIRLFIRMLFFRHDSQCHTSRRSRVDGTTKKRNEYNFFSLPWNAKKTIKGDTKRTRRAYNERSNLDVPLEITKDLHHAILEFYIESASWLEIQATRVRTRCILGEANQASRFVDNWSFFRLWTMIMHSLNKYFISVIKIYTDSWFRIHWEFIIFCLFIYFLIYKYWMN